MERKNEYELVKSFMKDYNSIRTDRMQYLMLAVIFELFHGAAMMIPYQEAALDGAVYLMPAMTGIFGPAFYLVPYFVTAEAGKQIEIGEKLRYLPVRTKCLKRLRIEKLAVFVCRIFPVFFCLQLLFSGLYYKEIRIGNILYAIFFGLVWPFLSNLWVLCTGNRK